MSRHATDGTEPRPESVPSPPLPADHVLNSGAVTFPGAFDQHGCPLIVFPADAQDKLSSELSKAEVADFVNYAQCLHNKRREKHRLLSVVADLRQASLAATRFLCETLLLLELHKRTVHSVYIVQPKKKDAAKLLLKLLAPSKSTAISFKKVLLKEIPELSNYIDRSQLPSSLGGYLMYSHRSWVAFIKDIDSFVQEFLLVVQRLPSCISTLQALSRLPLPSTYSDLQHFCSTNEAKFQQLRRELGLDELLRHCESVVEKLRYPESEPCYQDMTGTALFTHTVYDMLHNHSRITAAVEKVDLLWQQAFSQARLQLQVFHLRDDALQITERIETLLQEKLQPYTIEIAKDSSRAAVLASIFESSIHTPAMALVRCAEDVIHTLAEILPLDGQSRESWVLDLERLKDKLQSAVHFILQTLRAACNYHHYYNKANSWYVAVLRENFLQELLSGIRGDAAQEQRKNWGTIPAWRRKLSAFLKKNPPPDMEELLHLAHLSSVLPDDEVQQAGKETSQRCMTLRKLLISSGPVAVGNLQMALQWQYDLLRSSHVNPDHTPHPTIGNVPPSSSDGDKEHLLGPSHAVSGVALAEGKPASLSSFDSGFDGAAGSQMEVWGGRERVENLSRLPWPGDSVKPALSQPQIHVEENVSSVSDCEDHRADFDLGSLGNSSRASFQVVPKVTVDSLNFEIKVKRSAALPSNPWLSLPVDNLENSYTVTITPNPSPRKASDPRGPASPSNQSQDQQAKVLNGNDGQRPSQDAEWSIHSQSDLEESDLSPISNVLSSTITDGRDRTTEGMPTLLWDSYDLHDQNPDVVDCVMDGSVNDWDVKEQEGLSRVEKMLGRADEILEEEENVLAQEAVLDALLRSEDRRNDWPLWEDEDQAGVMSSTELAEAGVLVFEDCLDPSESNSFSEIGSVGSSSDAKGSSDHYRYADAAIEPGGEASACRPDLLAELRRVHLLDKMIVEENQRLQEFRHREDHFNDELVENQSKEREAFRLQLEKEKREVEKLEKSLDPEKNLEAKEVLSCSVMEKNRTEEEEDRALFDGLLSDSYTRSKGKSPLLVQNEGQDTKETETLGALSGANAPDEAMSQYQQLSGSVLDPASVCRLDVEEISADESDMYPENLSETKDVVDLDVSSEEHWSQPSLSLCQDPGGALVDPPVCESPTTFNSPDAESGESAAEPQRWISGEEFEENLPETKDGTSEHLDHSSLPPRQDQSVFHETTSNTDLKTSEDVLPQCISGEELDKLERNGSICSPEACLTPETKPDDGAFDPGGKPLLPPPVPKPRKALLPVNNGLAQLEIPHSAKVPHPDPPQDPGVAEPECLDLSPENVTTGGRPALTLNPNVTAHSNNNNNNLPVNSREVTSESEASDMHASASINEHLQKPPSPKLPPDQPLEFDPGGAEEWLTNSSVSYSESVRMSRSGSPGIQPVSNTREMGNFKTPVVLDTGSGLMKAGFAGQDLPSVLFPTIIGMPKYEEIMNGNLERETFIGHEAQHMRGVLALKHPIKNGIIRNWDDMEKIWHHTFQQLGVEPEDHPVLLTEAAMNPLENRQRTVEVMFECFGVPLTYVAMQAVLALYAAGRSTGVVFESGDGVSHSVPVFEGYCLPHAVQRFPLAGADVTSHLKKLLQEQGVSMRTSAEEEIVREMKEKSCYVALDYEAELSQRGSSCREIHYTMPDGQIVPLSTERFRAPEILFRPELIGRDHYGIHESVFKSILGSDIDLRRSFLGNVLLSGGNTLLPGLPERLQAELRSLASGDLSEAVRVSSPKERDFLVWRGGAVLVELPGFSSSWISQEEYEEHGPQIVFRKCF